MLRRKFMKMLGMVPAISIFHSTRLDTGDAAKTGQDNTIVLYGRVSYKSLMAAADDEAEFIKCLDNELRMLRLDWIRHYQKQLRGAAPTHINDGGAEGFIEEKL